MKCHSTVDNVSLRVPPLLLWAVLVRSILRVDVPALLPVYVNCLLLLERTHFSWRLPFLYIISLLYAVILLLHSIAFLHFYSTFTHFDLAVTGYGPCLLASTVKLIIIIIIIIIITGQKHWYEHVPKSVVTNQGGKVTILWNYQVQTDRTIPNNKPDIIIRDNEKGTCMLIDVAISGVRNVIKKEAEGILKYKDLTTNTSHVECKCKGDTSSNWSDWDHFQIIQKIREQHTRKPWR
jgi:hypothetical protein